MKSSTLLLVVVPLLPVFAACKSGATSAAPAPGASGKSGRPALVFAADVMRVEAKKVNYVVTAPGTIDAFEHVQVTARIAGAVDHVAFSEGQEVKKGDTLVVIDSERFRVAVNSANAVLAKADATVSDAAASVARREAASVKNPGLIPGEELESFRTKTVIDKADRDVAAQALRTAQLNLRDSTVRAPMAGIIQTRTVETGQYVQPGYIMATLLRRDPLLLHFQVEPNDAPRIEPGTLATFTLRETARTYKAKVTLLAGAADSTTHMVGITAEVAVEGNGYWLRPGSFCDVSVDLGADHDTPIIPRIAARATDHGYVSYVVEGDVARERILTLGMSTKDGWIEVRAGLKAGDLLVVHGAEALTDKAKVKVTEVTADSINNPDAAVAGKDAGAPPAHKKGEGPAPAASSSAGAVP